MGGSDDDIDSLVRAALAQARPGDALAHADAGLAIRDHTPSMWAELQLVRIDALEALGEHHSRRAAIAQTEARVERMLANASAEDRQHVLALAPYRRITALR